MAWTKEQELAIAKEGCNIIVSAGAGSGKTAVLTARVIRKLQEGVKINQLLILTFTKEAAKEMKVRIRKQIENIKELSSELDLIDQAYITTFDSYALGIVKKYHYLLNIKKDINIIDQGIINILKKKELDKIFDEYYEEPNPSFSSLIKDFCTKDDEMLKKSILNMYEKLELKIDKEEFLENYITNFYNQENINSIIDKYLDLIKEHQKNISSLVEEISFIDNDFYNKLITNISNFLKANNYLEIKQTMSFELPRLPKNSALELKSLKEELNNAIKELKALITYESIDAIKYELENTKNYVNIIIEIIKKLSTRINKIKQEADYYEFTDIAKIAIKIVKDNPEIRDELKYYYNEIMIDEYQDTNDLQEEFIKLIENHNVYMVGDIKQSIYRFRNANPEIFKNKYEVYENGTLGLKIDLLKNFRSRQEVLDNINKIFNNCMDLSIGGADYKVTHQMIFGNNLYLEEGKTNHDNNLEIYNYDKEDKTYSKEEKEIFIIAHDIKEKIKNNYQVFDSSTKSLRDITYSDFCIIMDRGTEFTKYKKIFEYLSIPLTIYKDEDLTCDDLSLIIKNIIGLLIKYDTKSFDQEYKYFLTSISRSFLFNLSDQEIFKYYLENDFLNNPVITKIKNISSKIKELNLTKIFTLIIDEFNFYEKIITIGDINKNLIKINELIEISKNLNEMGYTIYDFYNYLIDINDFNEEIKYNLGKTDTNSVKIMNIHKSKGLEFPICYYSGLHKSFNKSDIKDHFLFSYDYFITPIFNEGIKDTILKTIVKEENNKEEISEKIRLFYVGLTRAKEKMIIVTSLDDTNKNYQGLVPNAERLKYNSFLDIINSVIEDLRTTIKNIDLNTINLTKDYGNLKDYNYKKAILKKDKKITKIDLNLNISLKEEKHFSKTEHKLKTQEEVENMQEGTKVHYQFEVDNFLNPTNDYVKRFVKHFDLKNVKIYKEYEFTYEENKTENHGIIDLILEYENEIKIVDYKLKNTLDEAYLKQLQGYKNYIANKIKKPTSIYLYSILEDNLVNLP